MKKRSCVAYYGKRHQRVEKDAAMLARNGMFEVSADIFDAVKVSLRLARKARMATR